MSGRTFARTRSPELRMARLASYRPWPYWLGGAGWTLWFVSPLGPGWLLGKVFSELQDGGASSTFWWLLGALAAALFGAVALIVVSHRNCAPGVEAAKSVVRANAVAAQVASGGPGAGVRTVPVGDMVTRLRDDPFDMLFLIDNWLDCLGAALYGAGAVFLLVRIDAWATLAGLVPMVVVGFANRFVGNAARQYRQRAREASSGVGDFLNSAFEASLTVKVFGARRDVLRRYDQLAARRAKAAVGDETWNEVIWSVNDAVADLFVGAALVVAARRQMSAGDITLFASYLLGLAWLPMRIGSIVVGRRRYMVSAARFDALLPAGGTTDHLVEHRPLPILGGPAPARPTTGARVPLQRLDICRLTIAARGLHGIDLTVKPGQLVVVSGAVGSGKSSLLRAVVGLTDIDAGTVEWNGAAIDDRAAFFVPPQCSYVAQVPRLFAESLRDNLTLSHDVDADAIDEAIATAAFDRDVAELPDGLATLVGARGVRLSGGQSQRAAAARALVHRPELLVLDDLTSALDVETEVLLWDRLAASGATVLAASNRPVALSRADVVLHLG